MAVKQNNANNGELTLNEDQMAMMSDLKISYMADSKDLVPFMETISTHFDEEESELNHASESARSNQKTDISAYREQIINNQFKHNIRLLKGITQYNDDCSSRLAGYEKGYQGPVRASDTNRRKLFYQRRNGERVKNYELVNEAILSLDHQSHVHHQQHLHQIYTKSTFVPSIAPSYRIRAGYYWYRPFAMSTGLINNIRGIPIVENISGNVQKSWHLEAIKTLDRDQYRLYKMVMLKLSNSKYNIHPKDLLICCKGGWKVIQEGSFGTVYVGMVERRGNAAVKVPSGSMLQYDQVGVMKRFINEWDILSKCKHPHIISLHGALILGVFDLWLCTELVNGVDLHSVKYGTNCSRIIPIASALKMCRQLADVLCYLHTPSNGKGIIIHRDIKPENIIVDHDWNIKLCDFGDASESTNGILNTVSGATWLYAPPELLLHESISNSTNTSDGASPGILNEKWDIWSMGCVIQEMFGYTGPFHHLVNADDQPNIVCEKMINAAIHGLVPNIPHTLAKTKIGALILQCLDLDPHKRPSARDVCKILNAPDAYLM